jgi:hypothetical protein
MKIKAYCWQKDVTVVLEYSSLKEARFKNKNLTDFEIIDV